MCAQSDLCGNVSSVPETEGIKYTGSKLRILPYIVDMVRRLNVESALDAFSGTTRVAQLFAQIGYNTTANDISVWSQVFATCYLLSKQADSYYLPYLDELNSLPGYKGWFSEHYGGEDEDGKMPFQLKNTMRLDAIRDRIEEYNLPWEDKCVLLTSLILAMDAVDNTLGHYAAYLSGWSPRSYNDICLKLPKRPVITTNNKVIRGDVFDAVHDYHDLVYLDPPYGSNNEKMPPSRVRYAAYYHIWKTIILNDKPAVFGKANRREDTRDAACPSVFEDFKKNDEGNSIAMQAIKELIEQTNSHYILLSYGSGGRVTKEELYDILNSNGKVIAAQEINYKKNVMSNMRWTNEWINSNGRYNEYLFLMEKSGICK